ncbi:MAG: prolyl oligopeptidase family serine peptidase [Acidobacteria bacterium]|nr:prolyl oligopeptidase family serine peptidase [Acidobacteriota bacterium]
MSKVHNKDMLRRTFVFGTFSTGYLLADKGSSNTGEHLVHRSSITGACLQPESLVYLPPDHRREKKKAPLLVWLHGASLRGDDVQMLHKYGPPSVADRRGDFPFVVLSPQCPAGQLWTADAACLMSLVDEAIVEYGVDPRRVYLTGLSMGGGGAWFLGSQYPHRFGAVVPMCGPTQPQQWAEGLRHMPVWCFHGEKDKVVPLRRSRDMVQALKKIGNKAKFTILKGKGHDITAQYNNDDIYDWMLSKKVKS